MVSTAADLVYPLLVSVRVSVRIGVQLPTPVCLVRLFEFGMCRRELELWWIGKVAYGSGEFEHRFVIYWVVSGRSSSRRIGGEFMRTWVCIG